MERSPVVSSFLAAVGYNAESKTLEVEFKSGRIYQYLEVEPETHKSMMTADSVGNFYSRAITNRYEERRMHELEAKKGEGESATSPAA